MTSKLTLFTDFKIGDLVLKNRMVLAPLTRGRSGRSQIPNQANVDYYTQRACAGLIISEGTHISKQGMGWAGAAAIYEPQHVEGWKKVTKSVHDANGLIFCQLWHMGRRTCSVFHGLQPIAPSAIAAKTGQTTDYDLNKIPYQVPRALEVSEIPAVVEEYRQAALNAKEAGFDGVEIHSANGYFLDEWLQSISNTRNDQYGGSFENRFRIVAEVIEAVLTVFPSHRVGIRFSPNGATSGSMGSADNYDAFVYYISRLNKYNLGYLHLMDGLTFGWHNLCRQVKLADARKVFDGPIIGNVGYGKLTAEGAINTGAADLIAFGRDWISNPDLPARYENDWPLTPQDSSTWYHYPGFPEGDPSFGYSDYKNYSPPQAD